MFSRAKKREEVLAEVDDLAPAPPVLDAGPARKGSKAKAQPKPSRMPAGVPSLISGDVVIKGSIESAGEVQFDGEIEGDIRALGLIIGEGARVAGEVIAEKVRVNGTVEGTIRATRVELAAGALVRGDVMHTALAIEAGARFEGNVRHSDDPLNADPAATPTQALPPAPATQAQPEPLPVPEAATASPVLDLSAAEPLTRAPRRAKADLR